KLDILKTIPSFTYGLILGFLTGIPMGAKTSNDLLENNKINYKEASFLLSICNNPSPMFIINYITISQLNLPQIKYHILFIIYLSAIISGFILKSITNESVCKNNNNLSENTPNIKILNNNLHIQSTNNTDLFDFKTIDEAIMNGFEIITKVGGYIILFSILSEILFNINYLNQYIKLTLIGLIEITNGVNKICLSDLNTNTKIVFVTIIASFGGLSGLAQTQSMISKSRLSIKSYFIVKLINIIVSTILVLLMLKLINIV
ncbi:MAG TPA: hypothetical protein GXZ90_10345, partial [Clostridiales bacterium]|nr:hypothetical protein [Clostridiales bacterium]